MAIKPEYRHFYEGEPWQRVRRLVLRRAEDRCECLGECGKHQGYRCNRANRSDYMGPRGYLVRVVLQVAHLDHDPTHHDPERLRAFCFDCHNGYDAEHRARSGAQTRREKLHNLELPL